MRTRFLIFTLLFVMIAAKSQNVTDVAEQANRLYKEQKYESALNLYDSIQKMGYESAQLYYNIGNSYYKTKQIPQAILYYEKALKLDPKNEKAERNLTRAKLLTIDRIEEIPEFFLMGSFRKFIYALDSNVWAVISAVLFLIGIAAFLLFFLSAKNALRRSGFYTGIITIVIAVFTLLFARSSYKNIVSHESAIVMQATVTLKGSPSENSAELYIIHEGTKVNLIDSIEEWYEVRLSDGKKGWLKSGVIELI